MANSAIQHKAQFYMTVQIKYWYKGFNFLTFNQISSINFDI